MCLFVPGPCLQCCAPCRCDRDVRQLAQGIYLWILFLCPWIFLYFPGSCVLSLDPVVCPWILFYVPGSCYMSLDLVFYLWTSACGTLLPTCTGAWPPAPGDRDFQQLAQGMAPVGPVQRGRDAAPRGGGQRGHRHHARCTGRAWLLPQCGAGAGCRG